MRASCGVCPSPGPSRASLFRIAVSLMVSFSPRLPAAPTAFPRTSRALALRAAEACSLLRLLSAHNLGRLALRQLGSGAVDLAKLANLVRWSC